MFRIADNYYKSNKISALKARDIIRNCAARSKFWNFNCINYIIQLYTYNTHIFTLKFIYSYILLEIVFQILIVYNRCKN